jgi:hypothetical protein
MRIRIIGAQCLPETATSLFGRASCQTLKWTKRLARLIEDSLRREADGPTRDELRKTLSLLIDTTAKLSELLDSTAVRTLAPKVWDALSQPGAESPQVLSRLMRLAQDRLDLVPGGGGRVGAAALFGEPTPFILCAVVIDEVWTRHRGRRAVGTDEDALVACAALWRLAGGPVTERAQNDSDLPNEMWRRHLSSVRRRRPFQRRKRGEPAELKSPGRTEAQISAARDRVRLVLDVPRVQILREDP